MQVNDGEVYPKNPYNNYDSRFAEDFRGYLGSVNHLFRACSDKVITDMKQKKQDLWDHVPSTRKSSTYLPTPKVTFATHAVPSISNINVLFTHTNPRQPPAKMPRFYYTFVCIKKLSPSSQKPIPILINNSLPFICLHLGLIEDEESKMKMLLDTGAVVDSDNLSYHLWVVSECPAMVGEFIQSDANTGYDVVQLMAALDRDSSQQPLDHGEMTVVFRYRAPYLINNCDPLFIYFALGNDVSLRCIIGLPTLLSPGDLIDLVKRIFVCSELNRTFTLILDPLGKGLPDSVVFDNGTPTIPQGVATNVRHDPSLLHYKFAEGHSFSRFSTSYSDDIIMHETLFRGNVSRDLEYVLSSKIVREGGVTSKTNSSEPPRLNSSEARSQSNKNINNLYANLILNVVTSLKLLVLIVFVNFYYQKNILYQPKIKSV